MRTQHPPIGVFVCLFAMLLNAVVMVAVAAEPAKPVAVDVIVLVDASRTGKPLIVYSTADIALNTASPMRFLRLSPPLSTALECCVRVTRPVAPSRDLRAHVAETESRAPRFATARLTQPRPVPFIGVGVPFTVSKFVRENAHSFLLKRTDGLPDLRVQHCVTGETFHLRVTDTASSQERRRYALPLGMDVEADCTEQIMPTLDK